MKALSYTVWHTNATGCHSKSGRKAGKHGRCLVCEQPLAQEGEFIRLLTDGRLTLYAGVLLVSLDQGWHPIGWGCLKRITKLLEEVADQPTDVYMPATIAVLESEGSDVVACFVNVSELTESVQLLIYHNSLFGLFYREGIIYANDIWNDVQVALKPLLYPTAL